MPPENHLRRECQVFSRYLIGWEPSPYVLEKYCDAHQKVESYKASSPFDRFLLWFATMGAFSAQLADSYARVLAPRSALRKKLTLLLAVLESSSPAHKFLDFVDGANIASILLRSGLKGLLFGLSFLVAAVVLLPVQLVLRAAD